MRNTLLQIVFTIPILILVSCTSLPFTRSTTSPMRTETPTKTSTPSPTATITPNFTASQNAFELLETQIAQETQTEVFAQETQISLEATATAQEVGVRATAHAKATKQSQEAEFQANLAAFYKEVEENGVVFLKETPFISRSEHTEIVFSKGILRGKNIFSAELPTGFLETIGLINLGHAAKSMYEEHEELRYSGFNQFFNSKQRLSESEKNNIINLTSEVLPIEIILTDLQRNQMFGRADCIKYMFVTSYEYKLILELARKHKLPIAEGTDKFVYNAQGMMFFDGTTLNIIGFDLANNYWNSSSRQAAWAFERLNQDSSYIDKFESFIRIWDHISSTVAYSIMGPDYTEEEKFNYANTVFFRAEYFCPDSDCQEVGKQVFGYK